MKQRKTAEKMADDRIKLSMQARSTKQNTNHKPQNAEASQRVRALRRHRARETPSVSSSLPLRARDGRASSHRTRCRAVCRASTAGVTCCVLCACCCPVLSLSWSWCGGVGGQADERAQRVATEKEQIATAFEEKWIAKEQEILEQARSDACSFCCFTCPPSG